MATEIITLEEALRHVHQDAGADDEKVQQCIDAAVLEASEFCNRQFFANEDDMNAAIAAGSAGDKPMVANAIVKQAMLLFVGDFYAWRENTIVGTSTGVMELPAGAYRLLFKYREGLGV
ncbi:head-tail connector protein [Paraburkholderia xenovorans]|uniref:head-tail connector protein n=1 Tax=Paraburkholderia xenovorans TaxID=36873 RepID=UPI0015C57841|nr:head-tail connector protein [Paraburkholderia xenovorans]NPT36248.1 phage gp6-like head-tail connector protein [Paraburkholderia xenovorans]